MQPQPDSPTCPIEPHWCPECGAALKRPLPVRPVYLLDEVAKLLCKSVGYVHRTLSKHKHLFAPARYLKDRTHRRHRVLFAEEVQLLQRMTFHS